MSSSTPAVAGTLPDAARRSRLHVVARTGALAGAALAAVATFLPWITMPDPFEASNRLVASGVESLQGVAVLVSGVVALALVAVGGRPRLLWATVPATVVVMVTAGNLVDCTRPDPELGGLLGALLTGPDAAYGLWLGFAGGVVLLGLALAAGLTAPTPTARPAPAPTSPPPTAP